MNAMKKSAVALAVAAALGATAAQADTTLYGSGRVSIDYSKINPFGGLNSNEQQILRDLGFTNLGETASWDVFNDASRLGVKGSEDLGGGLSAIYQFEFGVDVTEGGSFYNNRPKWVGLKSDSWGAVTVGTQWTPYYNALGVNDIFNSDHFTLTEGNLNFLGPIRTDNTLLYTSPSWAGLSFQAALMANGNNRGIIVNRYGTTQDSPLPNVSKDLDAYNLSLIYQNGPFFAGATWIDLRGKDVVQLAEENVVTETPGNRNVWGLAAGYTWGGLGLSILYENGDSGGFSGPLASPVRISSTDNIYGTASYTFGSNKIYGGVGNISVDTSSNQVVPFFKNFNIFNWGVGYQYNLSKRTRLWIEYIDQNVDKNAVVPDQQFVSIGTRVDF
jgi:predicted porin